VKQIPLSSALELRARGAGFLLEHGQIPGERSESCAAKAEGGTAHPRRGLQGSCARAVCPRLLHVEAALQ